MSTFSLASVPGLGGTLTVTDNASGQAVDVEAKDPLLFVASPQTLAMQAAHRRLPGGAHEVTLTASGLALALGGGHIRLQSLTVTLRYADGAPPRWDAGAGAIVVSGDATWTSANVLGLAPVPLRVGYAHTPGVSGRFTFTLANPPLALPLNVARLDSGEFSIELPTARPVARLSVAGAVSLTSNGTSQVSQLLTSALGRTATLRPVRGRYTVELALQAGRLPDAAPTVGSPALQVDLDWPLNFSVPALPSLPDGLAVDLGLPTLHLPFGPGGPATSAPWSLGFRDTAIRFPTIAGLSGLRLDGSMLWESGVGNRFVLAPTRGGTFELPEILRVLLARLQWGESPLTLGQIRDAAAGSLPELEWQTLFAGLVPATLPNTQAQWDAFDAALRATLDAAALQFDPSRVFAIAFQALASAPDAILEHLWAVWLSIGGALNPLVPLPKQLAELLARASAAFDRAVKIFFQKLFSFDPGDLFAPLLDFIGDNLVPSSFELWARIVANAVAATPEGALPGVVLKLFSAILAAPWLQGLWSGVQAVQLAAINAFFSGFGLFGIDAFTVFTVLMVAAATRSFADFLRGNEPFASLMNGLASFFSEPPEVDFGRFVTFLQHMVFPRAGLTPEERRAQEERVLCAANAQPLFGILLALVYLPIAFFFNKSDALDLMQHPINAEAGRKVKALIKGKYLILSDIHRDTQRDKLPPLQVGSIHHFSNNKALFLRVLDWADTKGFTVLEGGDCEELWFIRDPVYHLVPDPATGFVGFKKQLHETIASHPEVYAKLRKLHHDGRYFRIFGNHDSYLRDPDMLAVLKAEMEKPIPGTTPKPFDVFDFFVIDDVKRMTESRIFETIDRDHSISLGNLPQAIGLGMDSRDYTKACRMLVTHGHQWDFFNCDSNSWLGKLISNAVATPFDRAMDLAIDARGLSLSGSPTVDFRDALANLFLFDNWPGREPAVKFAHNIQHLPNGARILSDGLMYRESVTAILGSKFTAINFKGPSGEITPQQSMADVRAGRLDLFAYNDRHHGHHVCIGHTHNPQSQPYFRLLPFVQELPVIRDMMTTVDAFFPVKSQYFNSGTCGWMDGVVWGILIGPDIEPDDEKQPHQARLVFWTDNSREPEFMDWELSMLDPDVKRAIAARFPAFHAPRDLDELATFLKNLFKPVGDLLANFGFDLGSGSERDRLKLTFAMPPEVMYPAMDRAAADTSPVVLDLSGIDGRDPEQLAATLDKVQCFTMGALMTAMGRGRTGTTSARRDFVLRLPAGVQRQRIEPLAAEMAAIPGATASLALAVASLMDHFLKDFPRNLPFFGTGLDRVAPFRRLALTPEPVMSAAMAVLPLMRLADPAANPLCQPMAFRAAFNAQEQLEFTLTVGA